MNVESAAYLVNHAHEQLTEAQRFLFTALERRAQVPGRKPGECGTPAGYKRHTRAGEPCCFACVDAYTWDNRRWKSKRRNAEPNAALKPSPAEPEQPGELAS